MFDVKTEQDKANHLGAPEASAQSLCAVFTVEGAPVLQSTNSMKEKTKFVLRHWNELPNYNTGPYGHVSFYIEAIDNAGKRLDQDSVYNGVYPKGLTVRCQIDADKPETAPAYAWEVCYLQPYTVDINDMERMLPKNGPMQAGIACTL